MITKQKAKEVISSWFALLNKNDINAIDRALGDYYTDDYVLHFTSLPDQKPGLADYRAMFHEILPKYPNLKVTMEDLLVDGDKIAFRTKIRYTDPDTGKPKHIAELCISRFVGDKIAEEWELLGPVEDDA